MLIPGHRVARAPTLCRALLWTDGKDFPGLPLSGRSPGRKRRRRKQEATSPVTWPGRSALSLKLAWAARESGMGCLLYRV